MTSNAPASSVVYAQALENAELRLMMCDKRLGAEILNCTQIGCHAALAALDQDPAAFETYHSRPDYKLTREGVPVHLEMRLSPLQIQSRAAFDAANVGKPNPSKLFQVRNRAAGSLRGSRRSVTASDLALQLRK